MKRLKTILIVSAMAMLVACGGKESKDSTPAATDTVTVTKEADPDEGRRENIKKYLAVRDERLRGSSFPELSSQITEEELAEVLDGGVAFYAWTNHAGELIVAKEKMNIDKEEDKNDGSTVITLKDGGQLLCSKNTKGELFVLADGDDTAILELPDTATEGSAE